MLSARRLRLRLAQATFEQMPQETSFFGPHRQQESHLAQEPSTSLGRSGWRWPHPGWGQVVGRLFAGGQGSRTASPDQHQVVPRCFQYQPRARVGESAPQSER